MSDNNKKWYSLNLNRPKKSDSCACGSGGGNCSSEDNNDGYEQVMNVSMDRRAAFKKITAGFLIGAGAVSSACSVTSGDENKEKSNIEWEEYFKGNYKLMSDNERNDTVDRLVRSYELRAGKKINMSSKDADEHVLFGYAFNISKCQGYMDCINGCLEENNQDRKSDMKYIRIHEQKNGSMNFSNSVWGIF